MRKRKENPQPDWDDGRVIADMNVEGMEHFSPFRRPVKPMTAREEPESSANGLTRRQTRMYTLSALKAGLLVAAAFSLFLILFTLFCLYVWLRV